MPYGDGFFILDNKRNLTGKDEFRQHLAELGFVIDENVVVISEIGGNLIVQVNGCAAGKKPAKMTEPILPAIVLSAAKRRMTTR